MGQGANLLFPDEYFDGAVVSEKHCNFILNMGGARARDVRAIIDAVQQTVEDTLGFKSEPEVEIVNPAIRSR